MAGAHPGSSDALRRARDPDAGGRPRSRQAEPRGRAYTGRRYGTGFVEAGAELAAWRHAPDFDDRDLQATFPQLTSGRSPRAVVTNLEHVFLRSGEGQARGIVEAGPFDVLVSDHLALGSALAAEMTGTPVATVALVPLSMPSRDLPPAGLALAPRKSWTGRARDGALRRASGLALRPLDRVLTEVRASLGLPPPVVTALDAFWSPDLVVAHGSAALEYRRGNLPRQVHFVGQLSASPMGTPVPPWWDEVEGAGRRVVHVTQGTYDVDPRDLIAPGPRCTAAPQGQRPAPPAGADARWSWPTLVRSASVIDPRAERVSDRPSCRARQ